MHHLTSLNLVPNNLFRLKACLVKLKALFRKCLLLIFSCFLSTEKSCIFLHNICPFPLKPAEGNCGVHYILGKGLPVDSEIWEGGARAVAVLIMSLGATKMSTATVLPFFPDPVANFWTHREVPSQLCARLGQSLSMAGPGMRPGIQHHGSRQCRALEPLHRVGPAAWPLYWHAD